MEVTLSEDGRGGPPGPGVVLGKYETRVIDMASAYATLADSGVYHAPHFVEKVVNADGEVLFDASSEESSGDRRIEADVADNVTSAMQPIPGWSNGHTLAGGRPSAAKTGTISSATPDRTATPGWWATPAAVHRGVGRHRERRCRW